MAKPTWPQERKLRLMVREDDAAEHLFVRLSPQVARSLKSLATSVRSNSTRRPQVSTDGCWSIEAQDKDNFLPLSISTGDEIFYASFNGGFLLLDDESSLSSDDAIIEVPRALISGLTATPLPSFVTVQALPMIPHGTRVNVEPVTVDDWELLQVHAEELERGALLHQVSLIYPNQQLSLRLQRDRIQVVVKEILTLQDEDSIWPSTAEDANDEASSQAAPPCVLLVQDTELIVSPKPRPKLNNDWSAPLRLVPCQEDLSSSMLELQKQLLLAKQCDQLVIPPGCVLVHPECWNTPHEWARIKVVAERANENTTTRLVRVIKSSLIRKQQAALHPWIRLDLGLPLYWGVVQLQPAAAEYVNVRLETISFRESVLADSAPSVQPWRLPQSLEPHYYASNRLWNFCVSQDVDQWILPVESVIPLSCLLGEADHDQDESWKFLRIISNTKTSTDSFGESILVMEKADRTWLLQQYYDSTCQADSASGTLETFAIPETNQMDISLPRFSLPSTINWSEPLVTDMATKTATMVILCGPTGSGKTHTALVLSALARLEQHKMTLYLDCKRLQESATRILDILRELDTLFEQAVKARSCLIVLDDLDRLAPNLLSGDEGDPAARVHSANPTAIDQSKLISDRILQLMEAALDSREFLDSSELPEEDMNLSIVITCPDENSLNPSLIQSSIVFQSSINVPTLSTEDRLEVLGLMMKYLPSHPSTFDGASIGSRTDGFRPRDLAKIACRVQRQLSSISGEMSLDKALDLVLDEFTPLSHLSLSRSQMSTGLDWLDIGGLFEVKAKLESTILHPSRYRSIYAEAGIRLPRGVFLFGPPGCGKSALVPALAKECNFPLIACKGPEILDKYIGASEAKVRELFSRASAVAPSILFLDELDALAPRRGSDNTGVTDRVVNQLLTFLDGVEDASTGTVYVIGATSRPDKVDPALLRPGRLEQHLFIGPPENVEGWTDLFSKVAKNWNFSLECQQAISSKAKAMDLLSTVIDNSRFSPADIKAALDTAHINAVHRTLKTAAAEDVEKVEITEEDLRLALRKTRPCLNEDDANVLEEVNRPFRKTKKDAKSEGGARSAERSPAKLKTTLR